MTSEEGWMEVNQPFASIAMALYEYLSHLVLGNKNLLRDTCDFGDNYIRILPEPC